MANVSRMQYGIWQWRNWRIFNNQLKMAMSKSGMAAYQ